MKIEAFDRKETVDLNAHYFILPIAFELSRASDGMVVCGPETKRACQDAIAVAELVTTNAGGTCTIVPTAGHVENGWNVVMAEVMAKYIASECGRAVMRPENNVLTQKGGDYVIIPSPAEEFSTAGEIREILNFATSKTTMRRQHIVVVVKNWHAPRVRMLLWLIGHYFQKAGFTVPDWTVVTVPSNVPYWHRLRELIALPQNAWRVWRQYRQASVAR